MLRGGPIDLPVLDVDVVTLVGDIARHTYGLEWATDRFPDWLHPPKVIYVAGNHEFCSYASEFAAGGMGFRPDLVLEV